jgi:hypothetical protein
MRNSFLFFTLNILFTLSVCAQNNKTENNIPNKGNIKIKITVNHTVLTATLFNNATTRVFIQKLPLTLSMQDLYKRELVYHFLEPLPTDDVRTTGYEVGEIIYWPPRHSFVIMYAQNEERFSMQKVGFIESGVEIFSKTGNTNVTFEIIE